MQQPQPAVPAEPTKVNAAGTSGVSEHQAKAPMSGNTPSSTIAQPLLASEIRTGASASTTGEEADVLRSFAEAGAPHTDDAIRQLSLQGELRAVSLRIDAITGEPGSMASHRSCHLRRWTNHTLALAGLCSHSHTEELRSACIASRPSTECLY